MSGHAPVGRLEDWTEVDDDDAPWPRYERGDGPAVILLHELHGITPEVLGFGDFLTRSGFHVVIPHLFGVRGERASAARVAGLALRMCVSLTFRALALGSDRPIARQLRAYAATLAERTGGEVGVVGMCFTGGFALAAAVDPRVAAPVMSQPAVPFPLPGPWRRDPGVSQAELAEVQRRAREEGLCVLGLRFSEDRTSPAARFGTLRERLGSAFEVFPLDSTPGNPDRFDRSAHSVLTVEVREDPPNRAAAARDRVAAFLHERLGPDR
jgi:dienelactone hydrolase